MKKTLTLLTIGLTSAMGFAQSTNILNSPTTSTPSVLDTDTSTGSATPEKSDTFRGPVQDSSSKSTMQGASTGKVIGSVQTNETDEMALAPLAKIKLTDAMKVAQPKAQGKIISAKLDNQNGYLVYNIRSFKDGQISQTFVDAGNGKLISTSLDSNTTTGSSKTQ
jgi:uncharacterized membrane protein YkoI